MYAFRAHRNGTQQTGCVNGAYTTVILDTTDFNDGGYYNTSTCLWTPPAGLVMFSTNVWCQANCAPPGGTCNQCVKVHKSTDGITWTDLTACPGWTPAGYPNTGGAGLCAIDYASGSEVYQLIMFTTSYNGTNSVVIDGNPAHTWWCGLAYG